MDKKFLRFDSKQIKEIFGDNSIGDDGTSISNNRPSYFLDFRKSMSMPKFIDNETLAFSFGDCPDLLANKSHPIDFFIRLIGSKDYCEVGKLSNIKREEVTGLGLSFIFKLSTPLTKEDLAELQRQADLHKNPTKKPKLDVKLDLELLNFTDTKSVISFIKKLYVNFFSFSSVISQIEDGHSEFETYYKLFKSWIENSENYVKFIETIPDSNGNQIFASEIQGVYQWAIDKKKSEIMGRFSEANSINGLPNDWSWSTDSCSQFFVGIALRFCALSGTNHVQCISSLPPKKLLGRSIKECALPSWEWPGVGSQIFIGKSMIALCTPNEDSFDYHISTIETETLKKLYNSSHADWIY